MSESRSSIIPASRYRDAKAAIEWLTTVFGFTRHAVYEGNDGTIQHAELTLNGGMFMLGSERNDEYQRGFKSPKDLGNIETRSVYIVVENIDAVHERAISAGGIITRALQETPYGSREFSVRDPEGHTWGVGTYNPWAAHE